MAYGMQNATCRIGGLHNFQLFASHRATLNAAQRDGMQLGAYHRPLWAYAMLVIFMKFFLKCALMRNVTQLKGNKLAAF
jgi:hypothetical protein